MNHVFSTDVNIILLLCKPKELKEVSLNNIIPAKSGEYLYEGDTENYRRTDTAHARTHVRTHLIGAFR